MDENIEIIPNSKWQIRKGKNLSLGIEVDIIYF